MLKEPPLQKHVKGTRKKASLLRVVELSVNPSKLGVNEVPSGVKDEFASNPPSVSATRDEIL